MDAELLSDTPKYHGMSPRAAYYLATDPRFYENAPYRTAATILAEEVERLDMTLKILARHLRHE